MCVCCVLGVLCIMHVHVLTFTDELCISLVGRQIDAEGDELRVYAILTAIKQHLHHLSVIEGDT